VTNDPLEFPDAFNSEREIGALPGNKAFFGHEVLRGLTSGIDDYVYQRQERWKRRGSRSMGPGLLGTAMWIDDDELIGKLTELSGACVVVTKQPRTKRDLKKLERLAAVNEQTPGLRVGAFPALSDIAPKVGDKPRLVGPYDRIGEDIMPTIRALGFRRKGGPLVPIMHAKLAILGEFWWHDEGALGEVGDFYGFAPARLWISSANFTRQSRRSLEFGYWTEDENLRDAAYSFVLKAIRFSEPLDSAADVLDPEFVPVDFDDAAMAEAIADMEFEDYDSDE
jgi:hypothetical protein